jgi:hypothetical protein
LEDDKLGMISIVKLTNACKKLKKFGKENKLFKDKT